MKVIRKAKKNNSILKSSISFSSVLYNTLNLSVVVLQQQELETAEDFILSGGERTSLINKFIQLGFFVEKTLEQKKYFKNILTEEIDRGQFLNEKLTVQTVKYIKNID
jgi:hypothetical protein